MFKGELLLKDGETSIKDLINLSTSSSKSLNDSKSSKKSKSNTNFTNINKRTHEMMDFDIGKLKSTFGTLSCFNGNHRMFVDEIESYCLKNYPNIDVLASIFFFFLDSNLLKWYYQQDSVDEWFSFAMFSRSERSNFEKLFKFRKLTQVQLMNLCKLEDETQL